MCNVVVLINVVYFHAYLVYVSARLIFVIASMSYIEYLICCIYVILLIACFISF